MQHITTQTNANPATTKTNQIQIKWHKDNKYDGQHIQRLKVIKYIKEKSPPRQIQRTTNTNTKGNTTNNTETTNNNNDKVKYKDNNAKYKDKYNEKKYTYTPNNNKYKCKDKYNKYKDGGEYK